LLEYSVRNTGDLSKNAGRLTTNHAPRSRAHSKGFQNTSRASHYKAIFINMTFLFSRFKRRDWWDTWDGVNIALYTNALETKKLSHHPLHIISLMGRFLVNFSLFFSVFVLHYRKLTKTRFFLLTFRSSLWDRGGTALKTNNKLVF